MLTQHSYAHKEDTERSKIECAKSKRAAETQTPSFKLKKVECTNWGTSLGEAFIVSTMERKCPAMDPGADRPTRAQCIDRHGYGAPDDGFGLSLGHWAPGIVWTGFAG